MKKIAVIQFPGSNCEGESIFALKRAGIACEEFLWNGSVDHLRTFAGYFVVGGFSYEDRSRAGVIASLDPVMKVIAEESRKGKVVLGICNGAQILVETGLVPGYRSQHVGMVLAPNRMERGTQLVGVGYYNDYCNLKTGLPKGSNAFNRKLDPETCIRVPFAHAEGRFIFENQLAERMELAGMLAFRYTDENARIVKDYPINPNGSQHNVAAVVNPKGNIMAMMPHPERVPSGDPIFQSIGEYLSEYDRSTFEPVFLEEPERKKASEAIPVASLESSATHLPVKLIITDNTAASVEDALEHLGFHVEVERWILWSVKTQGALTQAQRQSLVESGELLNTNKEWIDEPANLHSQEKDTVTLMVDSPVHPIAGMKLQTLKKRFAMNHIQDLRYRLVWKIRSTGGPLDVEKLIQTHLFHNPVSDQIFQI
jgi:phosphoribosylformylglycinamidine synthase subunit PurQ / glutaminase